MCACIVHREPMEGDYGDQGEAMQCCDGGGEGSGALPYGNRK